MTTRAARIRSGLSHPIIDADGHFVELAPLLNDEMPWAYLWSPNSIHVYTKRLQGFKPPSYATHQVWNAEEWTVTK